MTLHPLALHPRLLVVDDGLHQVGDVLPESQPLGSVVWLGAEVVGILGSLGWWDYWRICERHQWASLEGCRLDHLLRCPGCAAELDMGKGRFRYRAIQQRIANDR